MGVNVLEHNDLGFGVIGYEDALEFRVIHFYQVGYGVGVDEIHKVSTKLGFNSLSGIEISEQENIGLVASSEWAKEGRGWENQEGLLGFQKILQVCLLDNLLFKLLQFK